MWHLSNEREVMISAIVVNALRCYKGSGDDKRQGANVLKCDKYYVSKRKSATVQTGW